MPQSMTWTKAYHSPCGPIVYSNPTHVFACLSGYDYRKSWLVSKVGKDWTFIDSIFEALPMDLTDDHLGVHIFTNTKDIGLKRQLCKTSYGTTNRGADIPFRNSFGLCSGHTAVM